MEAGDGCQLSKIVTWKGDRDLFKRKFRAAARLSGMDSAIKLAEKLASGECKIKSGKGGRSGIQTHDLPHDL